MTDTEPTPPAQPSPPVQPTPPVQPNLYAQAPVPPRGLSITSMICGIAGLLFPFFLLSLAAVIFGHIGRKKEPTAGGFSLTGLITGYIGLLFSVFVVGLIVLFAVILPLVIFASVPDVTGYIEPFESWEPDFSS